MKGIVTGGSNNIFTVECEDGIVRRCGIKGKKLKDSSGYYNPLAPGDEVTLEADELSDDCGKLTGILPRKNEFVRWNVKGRRPQLLAANLDYLICVTTPESPPFRPRFVDRALIQADYAHIEPVILCNKCDLGFAPETDVRLAEWERLGYRVLRVSAKTGEGLSRLAALLEGKLSAFVGQSGVGKSSILNVLDPNCVLRTGNLSEKYGRGTHTTTRGALCHLTIDEAFTGGRAGGDLGYAGVRASVIDTPGVRRFVLHDISAADLALYFREMEPLVGGCSFGMSCSHEQEAGCKILEAVYSGVILEDRYVSWMRIREELAGNGWAD
ncbi:MAG: ribosome small subunit-dependent GTPase A [Spirochaetaceae bacterium]|jgi:ribosome biogenesis GTPase|nr:ribosome small subunit-dependent GTPase A [Spirochaetaceae bacterium]